jgi:hypothetical protein
VPNFKSFDAKHYGALLGSLWCANSFGISLKNAIKLLFKRRLL